MLKSAWGRAAIVASGTAVALAGVVLPAQAASTATGWRAVATISAKGRETVMTSVDAISGSDAWAVGQQGTSTGKDLAGLVEHWAGRSWQSVKLPSKVAKAWASAAEDPIVAARSATDVWTVTALPGLKGSAYLRLAGRTWTVGALPGGSDSGSSLLVVTSVVVGKSVTWVFGGKVNLAAAEPSFTPYAAFYNGRRWATAKVPATGEITAASAVSANNIWAVTGISSAGFLLSGGTASVTSAVLHWNGKSWQKVTGQPTLPAGGDLTSITTGKQVLVGGDVATSTGATTVQFTDQSSGSTWAAPVDLPKSGASAKTSDHLPYQIDSLVPAGAGSYWALSSNLEDVTPMLWHYAGGKWSSVGVPSFGNKRRALIQLSEVPGSASVWAVGAVGTESTAKGLIALTGPTPR
jgi:hypothetical protein